MLLKKIIQGIPEKLYRCLLAKAWTQTYNFHISISIQIVPRMKFVVRIKVVVFFKVFRTKNYHSHFPLNSPKIRQAQVQRVLIFFSSLVTREAFRVCKSSIIYKLLESSVSIFVMKVLLDF